MTPVSSTFSLLQHIILPSVTLSLGTMAVLLRITRAGMAGMMEVGRQDCMKFARAKGAAARDVLFRHGLKNALIPVVTIFGLQIGDLIAFATITETIFSWPGMSQSRRSTSRSRRRFSI
jgi:peptide/nickel transport system permease protein